MAEVFLAAGVLVGTAATVDSVVDAVGSKGAAPKSSSSDVVVAVAAVAASEAVDAASWRKSSAWWASAARRQLRPAAVSARFASSRSRRHCCFTAVSAATFARASRSSLSATSRSAAACKRRFSAVLWVAISSETGDTNCGKACTQVAGGTSLGPSGSLCTCSVLIASGLGREAPFQEGMWLLSSGAVAMKT